MSLIKCFECGKEFSDKADSCPNCGCPTSITINEIYKSTNTINICGVDYDFSTIMQEISKGTSWSNINKMISSLINEPIGQTSYICDALKNNDFSPWYKDKYGYLTNDMLETQNQENEERLRQKRQNSPHCPTCNSTDIKKIGIYGKANILGLGILSSDIGKTFKCNNCGRKW